MRLHAIPQERAILPEILLQCLLAFKNSYPLHRIGWKVNPNIPVYGISIHYIRSYEDEWRVWWSNKDKNYIEENIRYWSGRYREEFRKYINEVEIVGDI